MGAFPVRDQGRNSQFIQEAEEREYSPYTYDTFSAKNRANSLRPKAELMGDKISQRSPAKCPKIKLAQEVI